MTDPSGLNSSVSKVTDLESLSNDFFRHWVAANPWKVVFIPSDKFQGFDLIQKKINWNINATQSYAMQYREKKHSIKVQYCS